MLNSKNIFVSVTNKNIYLHLMPLITDLGNFFNNHAEAIGAICATVVLAIIKRKHDINKNRNR